MKKIFFILLINLNLSYPQDYFIYSIHQDFPMGDKDEILKKNYYLTLGKEQGVYPGTIMDVFRTIFVVNGANPLEKLNHRIKIAELKVIHSENKVAMAILEKFEKNDGLVLDFKGIRIGDEIAPKVKR